jgi:methyl-accepting chemotaxis protein
MATRDIARNADAAAEGVSSIADAIGEIETMADQTTHATTGLRHSAVALGDQTKAICDRIVSFGEDVRVAQALTAEHSKRLSPAAG